MNTLVPLKQRIKQVVRSNIERRGFALVRKPQALIHNPALELPISFDHILALYLFETDPADFFFIQVGAYDGVTNDPLCKYIRRWGLRGVLVEPQRKMFAVLQENYRDQPQLTLLNAAISDHDGPQDFYTVRSDVPGLPEWSQQIASFKLDNVLKHKHGVPEYGITDRIPNIEALIEVETVDGMTFDTLLDRTGAGQVDLLQIDAEGYDFEIIKRLNFARLKPRILHYEHMHLSPADREACVNLLVSQGYRIATGFADTTAVL